jgi:hypothetical protein
VVLLSGEDEQWDVVFSYTDSQAIEDGVLIPFLAPSGDTKHRVTRNAWEELIQHYRKKGYQDYDDAQFYRFFFAEMLPLAPFAKREYEKGGILKTDYDFHVVKKGDKVLWYLPNEVGGVTMMKPEDY